MIVNFIRNIFGFGLVDIVSILIPLITMPILTRTLGIEGYGVYLFYSTILVFGHTIIDYSSNINGIRSVATGFHNKEKLYSEYQTVRLTFMLAYCAIISVLYFLAKPEYFLQLSVFTFLYLLGYSLLPTWYLVATDNILFYSKAILYSKVTLLLSIVFFVRSESDLWVLLVSTSLPFFITSVMLIKKLIKSGELPQYKIVNISTILREGQNSFAGLFAPNLYNNIPILILASFVSPSIFAIFAIANRICSIGLVFQATFAKSIYPIVAKASVGNVLIISLFINVTLSTLAFLVIAVFGERLLFLFLGAGFEDVYLFMLILMPSLIFTGVSFSITHCYLLPNSYDRIYRTISVGVSVFSGALALVLMFCYGAMGVAVLITSARLLLSIFHIAAYVSLNRISDRN